MKLTHKKTIVSVFGVIVLLYMMSASVMTCYYWWRDVKMHDSFFRAALWSPIIGVFKATHWPYYVLFQGSNDSDLVSVLNDNQKISVQAFFAAYQYVQDIQKLSGGIPTSKNPITDQGYIESLINKALERLAECNTALLNDILPGWGDITEGKFIPALKKMNSGIKPGGDRNELARADALMADFDTWLYANWNKIREKVGE